MKTTSSKSAASQKAVKSACDNGYTEIGTTNCLSTIRKECGLKQSDLAEAIGCDVNSISRYERVHREPSLTQAMRLAKYLGRSVEELFQLKEDF